VINLSGSLVPLRRAAFAAAAAAVLCGPVLSAETPADEPPKEVQAIWKTQELSFYFQSFTTFYSCRSLEDRVRMILVELGADKSIKVRSTSCFGNEIARLPHLRINVTSPVEATPEALAELEKTRSTRELTARVRGERMAEGTEQFPAYWKPVSLSRGSLRLESGDCELVDQLKRHVLPKLSIRLVKDNVSCSPNQVSMSQPRLEVEALTAMPRPDEKGADKKDPAPAENKD
jgi:hypothetical protein